MKDYKLELRFRTDDYGMPYIHAPYYVILEDGEVIFECEDKLDAIFLMQARILNNPNPQT